MSYTSDFAVFPRSAGEHAQRPPKRTDASIAVDDALAAQAPGIAAASWLIQGLLLGAIGGAAVSALVIAVVVLLRQLLIGV